jgi:hypothetical protein
MTNEFANAFLRGYNPAWGLHPHGGELRNRGDEFWPIIREGRQVEKNTISEYDSTVDYLAMIQNKELQNTIAEKAIQIYGDMCIEAVEFVLFTLYNMYTYEF